MDLERKSQSLGQKPALIVVDMIVGFTDPACDLGSDCADVVQANQKLLAEFRARDLPVFFTTTIYRTPDEASVFRDHVPALNLLTPESKWVEVDPLLERGAHEILIEKKLASAFFGTDLADNLTSLGVDSLVVSGLTTSGCVRATALDGLQHNYPVFVPREAVGDRNQQAHLANLHDLHAKYADVVDLDVIIEKLE